MKTFGKAEKSEEFATKLAWTKRTAMEYAFKNKDISVVKDLADYSISRHYPDTARLDNPYLAFFAAVCNEQASLVASWMTVGFIHGVMNTDNMAISGETIDYGPCAFMDAPMQSG